MKSTKLFAAASVIALGFVSHAFAGAADAIGKWKDPENQAVCEIYSCDGGVCVKVLSPAPGLDKDDFNPDPALKGRSMAGVVLMSGAAQDGPDRWKGKLYNPEDGKTYSGFIEVKSKDEVKLEGCVLGGILCKSRTWQRSQ
jgi:uncharacterized protein (DUF2147 family)